METHQPTSPFLDALTGPRGELIRRQVAERLAVDRSDEPARAALIQRQRAEREEFHSANQAANRARYRRERPFDAFCDDFVEYLPTAMFKTLAGFAVVFALVVLTFYLLG